jgi:hypothetical protein
MDSKDALDRWQKLFYKVSTKRCTHISIEERGENFGSYRYDGSNLVDTLLALIRHIPKYHWPHTLDSIMKGITAGWWDARRGSYHECTSL